MDSISLTALAAEQLDAAKSASNGRSAHTVYGGQEHALRQTLVALTDGRMLDEHPSPGEATIQVVRGRVRLAGQTTTWEGAAGDFLVIPDERHSLTALEDSAVLLTVVVGVHHR
jgi:quercetin dioxygenase-like cupin family protein